MKGNLAVMRDAAIPVKRPDFRTLVDRNARRLFGLAYRLTGNRDDAHDVVQETFLKAYRNYDRFEPGGRESVWLNRIASNCAIDLVRRRRHRRAEHLDPVEAYAAAESDLPAPDRATFGGQVRERIESALVDLTDKERTAFVLRHFEERPIKEIARTMGSPEGSVKNNIFRAVRKLRAALEPTLGGSS